MPSILRLAALLCQSLMILRASLDTALLMLIYARSLVNEDNAVGLVINMSSDNGDRAITLSSVMAYVSEGGERRKYQSKCSLSSPLSSNPSSIDLWLLS